MGCQQEIAQGILDRGAGYVLALKENQGQLYEDVRDLFEGAAESVSIIPSVWARTTLITSLKVGNRQRPLTLPAGSGIIS